MSQKRKRSPEANLRPAGSEDVFRSEPVEDRSSTFVGLYSPSMKPKDLQKLEEIKSASHKMLAWRRESNQQSITGATNFSSGSDDDGEKYGGKRIEKVLVNMNVAGACVVARWYGGVLLGPVRFSHIEDCARQAIRKWQEYEAETRAKKSKTEQDANDKMRLVKTLGDRDQSIEVLRDLAAQKERKVELIKSGHAEDEATAETEDAGQSKANAVDYSEMPVDRLRALEKARDATLSFLLKRIDRAEAELVALQKPYPDPP